MLQHKYIHGCFKATATQKLFLLQGTRCWLRPTACSELLAPLPSSAHTCTPAPTHLQAAQGEQRAGLHLPTVTPPARNGGSSQEKGGPTSPHQFVQWVCNLQPTACPNVLELHSKAILHGTGLQRHQAVTVAAGVTASTQHPCKEKHSIANKPSLFNS